MISNIHELKMVEVAKKLGEKKMKPNMVHDYNNGMSCVDWSDQMVSYYDCLKKTTQWNKKLALHIFDIFMFNAFCLNSKYGTVKLPWLLKFREIVTTHLIGDKLNQVISRSNSNFHYLAPVPATEKKMFPTKPRRNCSKVKCKETHCKCVTCDTKPALCVGECFNLFHDRF